MRRIFTIVSLILLVIGVDVANLEGGMQHGQPIPSAVNALGPGRVDLDLMAGPVDVVGRVIIHNKNGGLVIDVEAVDGWKLDELHIHTGWSENPIPVHPIQGGPLPNSFDHQWEFPAPIEAYPVFLDFDEDLEGFHWGQPWEEQRLRHIAIHANVVKVDSNGYVYAGRHAWAKGNLTFEGGTPSAWWLLYPLTHKGRFHFIDSPVAGLRMISPTEDVYTDESGSGDYFPGEEGSFYLGNQHLGTTLLEHKVSPLDMLPASDLDDPRVANMAKMLQSFDADADPKPGITITWEARACLNQALMDHGYIDDWANDAHVDLLVDATIAYCSVLGLVEVSREEAVINLSRSLNSKMFRKNVSRSSPEANSKAKLNVMPVWFPALKANGESNPIEYYDDDGELIRVADEAKPVIVTFTQEDETTGAHDVWAAVSRDDGKTFKRKNISRGADRTSFTLNEGLGAPYYGHAKKPVFQVKGNKILVAWSSKFCKGGKPAYSIQVCPDTDGDGVPDPCETCSGTGDNMHCGPDYTYDDPYYKDDVWGVGGPQRSHDYTIDGFPEVGELPFSCVWTARGTLVTQSMINNSPGTWGDYEVGDIVWFKPERLTSARRDAYQIFTGAAAGAGFGVVWQEDPAGLRPGKGCGPGHGWSGATTNHKTDIWYSYVSWDDHTKVDTHFLPGGDPEHDIDEVPGRPKALVPMSLPVRLTNNAAVNTDNLKVELDANGFPVEDADGNWIPVMDEDGKHAGSHRYGYEVDGLCENFYEFINNQGAEKKVCITADGVLLDGDTGASRPNLFMQPYTKSDGTKGAWAILAYEETKGVGGGAPDHTMGEGPYGDDYVIDEGKNVHYHSFDATQPDIVHPGQIVNHPERDENDNILYLQDEDGNLILDYLGQVQFAYHNARRPRFALQGKSAIGPSGTIAVMLYKEGPEGQGAASDIMMRRFVVSGPGNPYKPSNLVCEEWMPAGDGSPTCVRGARNLSSTTVEAEWINPEADPDSHGENKKIWKWSQSEANLLDSSIANPYEDARAHRGQLRGDFLAIAYTHTPNWGAYRNGNDKHDLYVRRSFDGGETWTTDPLAVEAISHCQTFNDPETKIKEEVCTEFFPGQFESGRNVSQLQNAKTTVGEPRLVATPGTVKVNSVWTGIAEDKQNKNVFYVTYGTNTNPKKDPDTGLQDPQVPEDLFFSFSQDRGQHYVVDEWVVNPDSDGNWAGEVKTAWFRLAKGDPEQGEAQIRMTPDGTRFYATWLEELVSQGHSDIHFRRVMPGEFGANNAP